MIYFEPTRRDYVYSSLRSTYLFIEQGPLDYASASLRLTGVENALYIEKSILFRRKKRIFKNTVAEALVRISELAEDY